MAYAKFVHPETHFVLALLESHQGNGEGALAQARLAVTKGLPFERLLAGPRDALATLHSMPAFQEWAAQEGSVLIHGPMLGQVTDTGAAFWVRTAAEASVWVAALPKAGASSTAVKGEARTQASADYTAVVRIDGLSPNTEYTYSVRIDGKQIPVQGAAFRTYPRPGTPGQFSVAFGGGAGYVMENERMWTTIRSRNPQAMLMLGDNVYIDDPQHALTQRYCYHRRHSAPEWRELTSGTGIYAIWDDHDFGVDDSHGGAEIDSPAWKRQVWQIFTENWNNPAYGGGAQQPGCWFDFVIGDVHFILLDGRYYRQDGGRGGPGPKNPPGLENPSMLGPVQRGWLKDTLKGSTATFKVIASPVPWAPGTKGGPPGGLDTWDGFPAERDAIYDFLHEHGISGVLLLSADRHRSDIRRIRRRNGYDLHDFMSSVLTNYHTHPLVSSGEGWIFGYNKNNSFGLLHFDTAADDPKVTYEIVNIDNETVYTFDLKFSALTD